MNKTRSVPLVQGNDGPSRNPSAASHEPPLITHGFVGLLAGILILLSCLWLDQHLDWSHVRNGWVHLTEWTQWPFSLVGPGAPLLWVLAPGIFMLALCGSLLLVFDKPPNWMRLPVGIVFFSLQISYLSFRLLATLCLDTWPNAIASVSFFLSELFIHLRIAFGNLSLLHPTDRTAQADVSARLVQSGQFQPSVDVFVPTYSEPVDMLRRTLIGCQAMKYPRKTIYLLDDQRRPAMKALAEELGCQYLTRPDNRHAKAGNLNHALAHSEGELIACFDADFVPTSDFIERTIGFFVDPQVALVQTPQNFFNDDAPARNLGLEQVVEDEQRFFFRTLQPGRDAMNAIVCHGSCYVVRRSALEAIGGIPTETITEDWATSLKLQAAGYKLCYLNEALSAGVSADRSGEFLEQRSRWAQGTLQSLFSSTNPLTMPGLTWRQRVLHASGILYYLGSLSHLFNLVAPLLFLFGGLHLLRITVPEMIFFRLPFMVGYYMLFAWITNRTRSAIWTEFYDVFLAPTLSGTALRSLVKPFGRGFRVTDKTGGRQRLSVNGQAAWPFALLLGLHVLGLIWAVAARRYLANPDLFAIVTWFAMGNILVLWVCFLVTCDVARSQPGPRFNHALECALQHQGIAIPGQTVSVSEHEIIFQPSHPIDFCSLHAQGKLHLPSIKLWNVPVQIQPGNHPEHLTLKILEPTLSQQRKLIAFLYCRPSQWDRLRRPKGELRSVGEYYRAMLRMYPLAEST